MTLLKGFFLFPALLLVSPVAFAAFALSDVQTIDCYDASPNAELNIVLTTHDAATDKYQRRVDSIPYDYGNTFGANWQSGQMIVANTPDTQDGVISLADSFDANNTSGLVLIPGNAVGAYMGLLSGHIDTAAGRQGVIHYQLNCVVKMVATP